jgi:hypothetical protein
VYRGFRILSLTVRSLLGPDVGGDLEYVPHQDQDPLQDEFVILQPLVPVFPQQVAKMQLMSVYINCIYNQIYNQQIAIRIRIALMLISADPDTKRMQRVLPASGSGCAASSRIQIWNYLYGSRYPPPPPLPARSKKHWLFDFNCFVTS